MIVIMFAVLLAGPLGMRDPEAFATCGIIDSVTIFLAIMVSALGTYHRIPHLHRPVPTGERFSVRRIFREMIETLSERSFIALFLAMVFFSVATGLAASLSFLILNYF